MSDGRRSRCCCLPSALVPNRRLDPIRARTIAEDGYEWMGGRRGCRCCWSSCLFFSCSIMANVCVQLSACGSDRRAAEADEPVRMIESRGDDDEEEYFGMAAAAAAAAATLDGRRTTPNALPADTTDRRASTGMTTTPEDACAKKRPVLPCA